MGGGYVSQITLCVLGEGRTVSDGSTQQKENKYACSCVKQVPAPVRTFPLGRPSRWPSG